MASPSSARISMDSSTKQLQSSKRDVPGRSRLFNPSMSQSSRRVNASVANVNGGPSGNGSKHSTRVYLNGVDVTPQSLLVSRIKSTPTATVRKKTKGDQSSRSKASRGHGSLTTASITNPSFLASNASSSSAERDSDSESSSSKGDPIKTHKTYRKEMKTGVEEMHASSTATGLINQVEEEATKATAIVTPIDPDESQEENDKPGTGLGFSVEPGGATHRDECQNVGSGRLRHQPVTVKLQETATDMLFEQRSVCVALDAPEYKAVVARNKWYQSVCAQKKASDKYVDGRSQTLQWAQKAKEVMTAPPATRDAACIATAWDLYDCKKLEEDTTTDVEDSGVKKIGAEAGPRTASSTRPPKEGLTVGGEAMSGGDFLLKEQIKEIVDATLVSPGCVLDVDGDIVADLRARRHRASRPSRKTRDRHKPTSQSSQKSRPFDSQHSTVLRSTYLSRTSNASILRGDHSSSSLSTGASQDLGGHTEADGASSGSVTASSQGGLSVANASRAGRERTGGSGEQKVDNVYAQADTTVDLGDIIVRQRTAHVLQSSSLLQTVNIVERAIQQNVYHDQQVKYRNLPNVPITAPLSPEPMRDMQVSNPVDSTSSDELEKLWTFRCALTHNRSVACLAWSTANDDLLAVSYSPPTSPPSGLIPTSSSPTSIVRPGPSPPSLTTAKDGLVLFWSLTNPEYPDRIFPVPVSATSIAFSAVHPHLLAVGFVDGIVAIYDTRTITSSPASTVATPSRGPLPMATSAGTSTRHLQTVWQVKWVQQGGSERVVSVSADGRVVEWSLKKGLSASDLMTLKRVVNPLCGTVGHASGGRSEGVLSQLATGRSLAFANQDDPSVYYVGTHDGVIHKCSLSYNEQYLHTYIGHTGPVYQVHVSPFCRDVFLSCSGDWSLKVWHQSEATGKAMLTLHSVDLTSAVLDAAWSPMDAGLVAAVAEDGRIELWDLFQSTLDPIVGFFPKKDRTTRVKVDRTASDMTQDGAEDDPDPIVDADDHQTTSVEVPVECTTVLFAPKAPVLIVGDSTGDVTVYRVPAKGTPSAIWTHETVDAVSYREEEAAKLLRAIRTTRDPQT